MLHHRVGQVDTLRPEMLELVAYPKRLTEANARRMDIEAEIEVAVARQIDYLTALDEAWTSETLYTDGDLTLAGYPSRAISTAVCGIPASHSPSNKAAASPARALRCFVCRG